MNFWDASIRLDLLLSEGIEEERAVSRLEDKWAKAGGVVQRVEQRIESRLDRLIAREDALNQKTDQIFDKQEMPLSDSEKALDALDRKLDLLSNGGPSGPLPGSGDSQEAADKPAEEFRAAYP